MARVGEGRDGGESGRIGEGSRGQDGGEDREVSSLRSKVDLKLCYFLDFEAHPFLGSRYHVEMFALTEQRPPHP